jgi:hypothetical protein
MLPLAFVAVIVKEKAVPTLPVGVPVIAPVDVLSARPAGKVPAVTAYDGLLVATTPSENSTPLITVPRTLSIQFGTRTMFPLKSAVAAPEALAALMVKLNAPDPEGVPVTAPVELFKEIPAGSEPALTE